MLILDERHLECVLAGSFDGFVYIASRDERALSRR